LPWKVIFLNTSKFQIYEVYQKEQKLLNAATISFLFIILIFLSNKFDLVTLALPC